MINIPNKLVIFGAVAAAALVVPGFLGPLMLQEAQADHQRNEATQFARGVVALNANVQANVDVENNNVCVVVETCG